MWREPSKGRQYTFMSGAGYVSRRSNPLDPRYPFAAVWRGRHLGWFADLRKAKQAVETAALSEERGV